MRLIIAALLVLAFTGCIDCTQRPGALAGENDIVRDVLLCIEHDARDVAGLWGDVCCPCVLNQWPETAEKEPTQ